MKVLPAPVVVAMVSAILVAWVTGCESQLHSSSSIAGDPAPRDPLAAESPDAPASRPATRAAAAAVHPVTYGYDARGRLSWAEYPSLGRRIRYEYDDAGNHTARRVETTITRPDPTAPVLE